MQPSWLGSLGNESSQFSARRAVEHTWDGARHEYTVGSNTRRVSNRKAEVGLLRVELAEASPRLPRSEEAERETNAWVHIAAVGPRVRCERQLLDGPFNAWDGGFAVYASNL